MSKKNVNEKLKKEAEELLAWATAKKLELESAASENYGARLILIRCAQVCSDILEGKEATATRVLSLPRKSLEESINFESDRDSLKNYRESVLRTMIFQRFSMWMENTPDLKTEKHPLIKLIRTLGCPQQLGGALLSPALMPDREHPVTVKGGYAATEDAKSFFENHLRATLEKIDLSYEDAGFSKLAPAAYNGSDPSSIQTWSYAWTQATAALATDWMARKATHPKGPSPTVVDVIRLMHIGGLPQFKSNSGTLPTGDEKLRAQLRVSHLLCQVLRSNAPEDPSSDGVWHLNIKEISSETSGGKSYGTGRSIGHVYLTVWLERMSSLSEFPLRRMPMAAAFSSFNQPSDLPLSLVSEIAPGQHLGVSAAIKSHGNPNALRSGAGTYYAASSALQSCTGMGDGAESSSLQGLVEKDSTDFKTARVYPLHSQLVNATAAPADRPQSIGGVTLDWDVLDIYDSAQWLDLAFVVKCNGAWRAVTLEMVEDETQEGTDRVWLYMDPELVEPDLVDALRQALPRASWVYRPDGLGVFVAGAVDIDPVGPAQPGQASGYRF